MMWRSRQPAVCRGPGMAEVNDSLFSEHSRFHTQPVGVFPDSCSADFNDVVTGENRAKVTLPFHWWLDLSPSVLMRFQQRPEEELLHHSGTLRFHFIFFPVSVLLLLVQPVAKRRDEGVIISDRELTWVLFYCSWHEHRLIIYRPD